MVRLATLVTYGMNRAKASAIVVRYSATRSLLQHAPFLGGTKHYIDYFITPCKRRPRGRFRSSQHCGVLVQSPSRLRSLAIAAASGLSWRGIRREQHLEGSSTIGGHQIEMLAIS
jgi:hypothetical protein